MYVLDPLHDYAIVQTMPDVMQRIASSNPDLALPKPGEAPTGRIILPDTMAYGGMPADSGTVKKDGKGNPGAVTTLLVGRVLWTGHGKWREGTFVPSTLSRGDLVLFMPRTVSYDFNVHGRSIKIVPYHELVSVVRDIPADSQEWRDFLAFVEGAVANDAQPSAAEAV